MIKRLYLISKIRAYLIKIMSKYKEFRLNPTNCQKRLFFKKDLNIFVQNSIQRETVINVQVIKIDRLKNKKY